MALQWFLLVFIVGALVASMAMASLTLVIYWDHHRLRNYLGYRLAHSGADPSGRFALSASTVPHGMLQMTTSVSGERTRRT